MLISGLVGGVASLTYEDKVSFKRAILLIVTGAATAVYLQPVMHSYFGIEDNFATGMGFVLGLVSMRIINILLSVSNTVAKNPSIIFNIFNIRKDGDIKRDSDID